jgi:hypothetical protein
MASVTAEIAALLSAVVMKVGRLHKHVRFELVRLRVAVGTVVYTAPISFASNPVYGRLGEFVVAAHVLNIARLDKAFLMVRRHFPFRPVLERPEGIQLSGGDVFRRSDHTPNILSLRDNPIPKLRQRRDEKPPPSRRDQTLDGGKWST